MLGAVGSVVLMWIHGRNAPVGLIVLFTGWVLAPFVGLAWADRRSSQWSRPVRGMLHYVMLLVSVGSLAIYAYDVASGFGRAVLFVAVPAIAWLLILVVLPLTAVLARRSGNAP